MDFPQLLDYFREAVQGHVWELGSHDGSRVTEHLISRADRVTCIELDQAACSVLRSRPVRVYSADWHEAVRSIPDSPDLALLLGVLYHSHSPLGLLEDLVNYHGPKWILLDTIPGAQVKCVREAVNQPGQRQSRKQTSGISIHLGSVIVKDAMISLGYELVRSVTPTEGPKKGLDVSLWRLRDRESV